jgi:hypothetical protein
MTDEIIEEPVETDVEPVENEPETDEYAEEAVKLGWTPPENWKGEGNPMSAEAWMTRGPGLARKLQGEVETLKEQQARIAKEHSERLERQAKAIREAERVRAEQMVNSIKAAQRRAVEEGDTETFEALEAKRSEIKVPDEPEEKDNGIPPEEKAAFDSWIVKNPWFKTDYAMSGAATGLYSEAEAMGITTPAAKYEYVDRKMREEFPHKFDDAPKRRKTAAVEGQVLAGGKKTGKGWNDIPKEERDDAIRFIINSEDLGPVYAKEAKEKGMTPRELFAQSYWSDE